MGFVYGAPTFGPLPASPDRGGNLSSLPIGDAFGPGVFFSCGVFLSVLRALWACR